MTETEFNRLAAQWQLETRRFRGDMPRVVASPSYRQVVAGGAAVVPFLIEQLRQGQYNWFAALKEITGKNPVRRANMKSRRKAAKDWIAWFDGGMP